MTTNEMYQSDLHEYESGGDEIEEDAEEYDMNKDNE